MAKKWERSEAIVAQRISSSQVGGFLSKKIKIGGRETAILEKDGESMHTFESGTHKIAGPLSGSGKNIVFVDKSAKAIRRDVMDLWTKQDKKINASVEMRFMVDDPEKVRKLLMGRRDVLTIEDVWEELKKEIVASALVPVVKRKGVDDLVGEMSTEKEIQVSVEVEARKKFEIFGLNLLSFSAEFILPEDYEAYLKRRGERKEEAEEEAAAEEEDTRKTVHERDMAEVDGSADTKEKMLDDMEQERIKREAEMQIEEEETQQDMKDAMEALKLKEIKDKQKMIRDTERKNLGLESLKETFPAGKAGELEERYESLQNMIGATEKKYFQRKIDKDAFKKLMDAYEKEKTEIEVKMGKKK